MEKKRKRIKGKDERKKEGQKDKTSNIYKIKSPTDNISTGLSLFDCGLFD